MGTGLIRWLVVFMATLQPPPLRAVEGKGRERTRCPESPRHHSFYIPANREGRVQLGDGIRYHRPVPTICINGARRRPNLADRKEWGGCWSGPGGKSMLIPGFACSVPGNQGPVQLLQPQVPPACQPALLDLPGLPDDTPTERECHLDRAPGTY